MKKIVALWRGMPREMRMVLAMAGLASPYGLYYLLKKILFPGWTNIDVFIAIFLIIGGIGALLGGWFD